MWLENGSQVPNLGEARHHSGKLTLKLTVTIARPSLATSVLSVHMSLEGADGRALWVWNLASWTKYRS